LARLDPAPGEIVAVIDGADRELFEQAAAIGAQVVVLDERGGPARARNRGAEEATRDILMFVDADVEAPPGLVAKVVEVFTEGPGLAAAIGSYDEAPGDPGFLSQYRNLLHHLVHQNASESASTFWAGCGAIRRRVFLDAGGFDESYTEPSIEDIELGARLVRAGHAIRLVKDLQVKHLKTWHLGNMVHTDLWRRAVPWTELMLGDGRILNDLNVKTRDRLSVALAFVLLAALAGAWWWTPLLAVAGVSFVLIVAVNADLFRFFLRERGARFTAGVVPVYWLYLLTCGAGFALGLVRHLFRRRVG
jgi:GT2 family glycosyltransferase